MSRKDRPNVLDDTESTADAVRLQPVDNAAMAARPGNIGTTYVEAEYDALASEQEPLWRAEAHAASRAASTARAGAKAASKAANRQLEAHVPVVEAARERYLACQKALAPFRRREPGAKTWYLVRWGCLLCGDVAGQLGAALSYGEPYSTAVPQAVATGMAALTAGMVGGDLRDLRMAARRATNKDDLPEGLHTWEHLFRWPDRGTALVKIIVGVAAAAALTIAGGIYGIRALIDGHLSGLVYGLLAIGITLASAINSWVYADEVADLIDSAQADYKRELKRANRLAVHPQAVRHAAARDAARSLRREHRARGTAAGRRLGALKWRVLRDNPGIAGHGFVSDAPAADAPIGRKNRGGEPPW